MSHYPDTISFASENILLKQLSFSSSSSSLSNPFYLLFYPVHALPLPPKKKVRPIRSIRFFVFKFLLLNMFPAGYDLLTWPGLEICEMLLILLTSGAFIAFQFVQQLDYASKVFLILLCIMVMSFRSLSLSLSDI